MSADFSIDRFIETVKSMDYPDIIRHANDECAKLEAAHRRIKGRRARGQSGLMSHVDFLKGFLFFIQGHGRPHGLSDHEFQKIRPVVQALVDKGQFKDEVLNWFK